MPHQSTSKKKVETFAEADAELWERIGRLEERIDTSEKSFSKKFSIYGSLVALVISIAAGLYGFVDLVFWEKERALDEQAQQLSDYGFRLTSSRSQIQAAYRSGNIEVATSLQRQFNLSNAPLTGSAKKILRDERVPVSVPTLLLFINEYIGVDPIFAEKLALRALDSSETSHNMAYALAALGQLKFINGDGAIDAEIDKLFDHSLEAARQSNFSFRGFVLRDVIAIRTMTELLGGNCTKATEAMQLLASELGLQAENSLPPDLKKKLEEQAIQSGNCVGDF